MNAIYHFSHKKIGHGHWRIQCEVEFNGLFEYFNYTTSNSEFIDHLSDLRAEDKTHEEIQEAYSEFVMPYMEGPIEEWIKLCRWRKILQWASGEYLTEPIPMRCFNEDPVEFISEHLCESHENRDPEDVLEDIESLASYGFNFFLSHFKQNRIS